MHLQQITEPKLAQYAYLIGCQASGEAIIIDPQRDVDRYRQIAEQNGLKIVAATETHIHADYLTGLREFAEVGNVHIYASGTGDGTWQYHWLIGSDYKHTILSDGDVIRIGNILIKALHTPGHTPEHLCFLVTDLARDAATPVCLISGDFVFVGDVGRPDLLEKAAQQAGTMVDSAEKLYESLQRLKSLPAATMLLPGHGAGSACGKALGAVPQSTIGYELATNPSIRAAVERAQFVDYILRDQPEPPPYFARMKELNRTGPAVLGKLPWPKQFESELIEAAQTDTMVTFIDTRSWEEFREAHLPGALFIPTTSAFSTLIGSYVDPASSLCFIAAESDLDEIIRHCIRVGVDNVDSYITPEQFESWRAAGGDVASVKELSMAELQEKTVADAANILDVRRAAELLDQPGIKGAINIAHSQLDLRFPELSSEESLYVYCRTGNRSRYATAFLKKQGYDAINVADGVVNMVDDR